MKHYISTRKIRKFHAHKNGEMIKTKLNKFFHNIVEDLGFNGAIVNRACQLCIEDQTYLHLQFFIFKHYNNKFDLSKNLTETKI